MYRRIIQLALSLTVMLSMVLSFAASTPARAQSGPTMGYDPDTGHLIFVGAAAGSAITTNQAGAPSGAGPMGFVNAYASQLGLSDPSSELTAQSTGSGTFDDGVVTRYQQVYKGIPVFGGNIVVSTTAQGALMGMDAKIDSGLNLDVTPTATADQAALISKLLVAKIHSLKNANLKTSEPALWIYDDGLFTDRVFGPQLVWNLDVTSSSGTPVHEVVLVSAKSGKVLLHYNLIDEDWGSPKALPAKSTVPAGSGAIPLLSPTATWTVDTANNTYTEPGTFVCSETTNNPACMGDLDAQDARRYGLDTYNFYWSKFNRNSIDNLGLRLISTVHYGPAAPTYDWFSTFNAFWDGEHNQMVYWDWMAVDDVAGHEITHGVTDRTSNLIYAFQPGAINESMSDVFGQFIDLSNSDDYIPGCDTNPSCRWLLGEDIFARNYGATIGMKYAVRDMKNPPTRGQPDSMGSSKYYTGPLDEAGVHTNSGVGNKAAYLMTDGTGTGNFNHYVIRGLDIDKVAHIYYQAQTHHVFQSTDYQDLYYALNASCTDLIGNYGITSDDCTQVQNATLAVQMNIKPTKVSGKPVTDCPKNYVVGPGPALFTDDFESGLGKWNFWASDNLGNPLTSSWGLDSTGMLSKTGHTLYAPGPTDISDGSVAGGQETATFASPVSLPAGQQIYMTFRQMYLFETDQYNPKIDYDGGVLEYSTDGGTTWIDATKLFSDGIKYNGKIYAYPTPPYNPLGKRSAFVGSSLNDGLRIRYNLTKLAGQNVLFRWHIGYDYSTDLGWYIDNVNIHTCVKSP